jgi:hypothetical protein
MRRQLLSGKPVHEEGIHHITSKELPNMATRYYMWLNNEVPNTRDFGIPTNAALFREMMKDDPFFKDARESFKEIYEEKDGQRVLIKTLLNVQIKPDLILYIPDYGASIAYGASVTESELNELTEKIWQVSKKSEPDVKREKSFSMVVRDDYGNFELHDFSIRKEEVVLEQYYNDDLIEIHPSIVSFLSDKDSAGLILLHGQPGTGKTSYLRHLIRETDANFIYLPLNLLNHIGEPSFLPFISRLKGAVIILEDCEDLLRPRTHSGDSSDLSTLLNLADGLLGDALRFKIVCTFNADIRDIDKAIMRKGRLFCRYEFHCLSYDKTNALLEHLGKEEGSDIPLILGDIFNFGGRNNQIEEKKKIGF